MLGLCRIRKAHTSVLRMQHMIALSTGQRTSLLLCSPELQFNTRPWSIPSIHIPAQTFTQYLIFN